MATEAGSKSVDTRTTVHQMMSHGESPAKSSSQGNQNMASSDSSIAHHQIFRTTHLHKQG